MPEYSDQEMVQKAVAGDMQAFRRLVERHQSFAYRIAYRFVGAVTDAEDITQESFVRLWRNLEHYRPEVKLTTWLYRIVANLCLDFLKSRYNRNVKRSVNLADHRGVFSQSEADQDILHGELNMALEAIAEDLSPKQKVVFVLRDLQGLSMEEIETILSMSAGKVKSNLYYARKRIAERLEQYYATKKPVKS
jgi:RNA polymerase sigma-70 factor (ECF subfamily)